MTLTHFIIILFKVITQFFHKEHERIDISKQFFSEFHKNNKFSIKHNYAIQSKAKNIDLKSVICEILLGKLGNISSKKSRKRQSCPISSPFFKVGLRILVASIRQENFIKGIQIGKEEVKLSQLSDDMVLYLKGPKDFM